MIGFRHILALCSFAVVSVSHAQVTVYDAATQVVTLPSVSVGPTTFTGVTLRNRGNFVFDLTGYAGQPAVSFPGAATYEVGSGMLSIPAVKVADSTYLDVTLLNTGNYAFTLQNATLLPPSVVDEVNAFARSYEGVFATRVPATGAERLALTDACWASSGRTRANYIADYDANLAEYLRRDAYLVGRKVQNIQVLALRNRINPDGSSRREIDVQWDTVYTDGSVSRGDLNTLISGSSAGTPRCTTAQTGTTLRLLGDQQLVGTRVRANNIREERYAINGGAPLTPLVRYRREVEWAITDPMGNATHVVVTGPGPTNTTAGVTYPFSMKFLSPRILKSAPELQGKTGNFLNWLDDDVFRNCALSNGAVPVVALVDCVNPGGSNSSWGIGFTSTPDAAADQSFLAQGWVAGAVYRFDVYNDDGWKTVNGQAGKTPIATYYDTLDRLPYGFVQMADRYPVINLGALTPAQVAANAVSATPAPLAISWTRPATQADGRVLTLEQVWEFHQGPKLGNVGGAFNPAYRTLTRFYPGTTATSTSNFPVTPPVAGQNGKTYTEYLLFFWEPGSVNSIRSRILFQ
jgi:hypothetical protein